MPNSTNEPTDQLLSAETLAQGAAIATLTDPARSAVLEALRVHASGGGQATAEAFDAADRAAEVYLAAAAAIEGRAPLEILRGDPFDPPNMATYSHQFERLLARHHYRAFCAEYPADQPLDPPDPAQYVGLVQGGPGTRSWHAPGRSVREVLELADRHEEEGLQLVALWDLYTGRPAVSDYVIGLTIHVQAHTAEQAFEHVTELIADMDSEVLKDPSHVPAVHHLHAAGPFYGPARGDAENVESIPRLLVAPGKGEELPPVLASA